MATSSRRVIPLAAERAEIRKRRKVTGAVRVTKAVRSERKTIVQPISRDEVSVRRVPVGRFVEGPVPVRQDGDTTIVPVLEEVPVVQTRLLLKEEVHITRRRIPERRRVDVTLRRQEPIITRSPRSRGGRINESSHRPVSDSR